MVNGGVNVGDMLPCTKNKISFRPSLCLLSFWLGETMTKYLLSVPHGSLAARVRMLAACLFVFLQLYAAVQRDLLLNPFVGD